MSVFLGCMFLMASVCAVYWYRRARAAQALYVCALDDVEFYRRSSMEYYKVITDYKASANQRNGVMFMGVRDGS